MNTLDAFAKGNASREKELMVFDWNKAAELIKERKPEEVQAGLSGDWGCTGGTIYENGVINADDYTYLASTWAEPEIDIDGDVFSCFKMQSEAPSWGSSTKWPESSLKILTG